MPALTVELGSYGRAFIYVADSKQTYTYDPSEGFRDGKGTHVPMWMQGQPSIEVFSWNEEFPFPLLGQKIARVKALSSFKDDVAVVIDSRISVGLRTRALARAQALLADGSYQEAIDAINWSATFLPEKSVWDLVPMGTPISSVFTRAKNALHAM